MDSRAVSNENQHSEVWLVKCVQFSPSAVFCADTGIYTGAVLADDTGAVRVIQVGLPLPPVVVADVCSPDTVLHDPLHLWDMAIDTALTWTARTYKHLLKNNVLKLIKNSSSSNKRIMMLLVFGYLILISIDFYDFISPFSHHF